MKTKEAQELGGRIAALVEAGQIATACDLLSPVFAERTPFAMLRHIGDAVGAGPLQAVNDFMERVAAEKTIGGWVVIASVLEQQLECDLAGAFDRCAEDEVVAAC